MTPVGFAILSYNEPDQLLSLIRALHAIFDAPPIVCHHNFDQCDIREARFPPNVQFIHPHIKTRWGHITTCLAALKALDTLRRQTDVEWFALLSGSDYPVKPAEDIINELSEGDYDAYLDYREIGYGITSPEHTAQDGSFNRQGWIKGAYDRYCAYRLWWPSFSPERLRSGMIPLRKNHIAIRTPRIVQLFERHRPERIYGGRFWFQANRKSIDQLLDAASLPDAVSYFRRRPIPEEALFHTILCSQQGLRICRDSKRYEEWPFAAHPKWLTVSDIPKIFSSGAHFARKFRPDGEVQSIINKRLGL